jgi:uncharacterized protein YkwD
LSLRIGQEVQKVLRESLRPYNNGYPLLTGVSLVKKRFKAIAILTLICVVACSAGSQSAHKESTADKVVPAPKEWVPYYGGQTADVELTDAEKALWNRVMAYSRRSCAHDSRLTIAAREHASMLSQNGQLLQDGDMDRLRFTFLKLGGTDYGIQPFVTSVDEAGLDALFALIKSRGAKWSHCGVGVMGTGPGAKAVWIGVDRVVDLSPFSVSVYPGTNVLLRGRVLPRSSGFIHLFVGYPGGEVHRFRPVALKSDGRFNLFVPLKARGRSEIELMVDSGRGLETVVLVPIFVGEEPDTKPVVVPNMDTQDASRSPEETLFDYLVMARKRAGVIQLIRDAKLDKVARTHSEEMAQHGFFGHVSPYRGALAKRLARDGLSPARSAENVARSRSLLRIHRNLLKSPSHRVNALGPEFTHVGIGVARDGDDFIATEIFGAFK